MIAYYKQIADGYIVGIGTNGNDSVTEITESEYNAILNIIHAAPTAPEGYQYRLRASDLEWELVELPPAPEPGDEVDDSEALDIILGGAE